MEQTKKLNMTAMSDKTNSNTTMLIIRMKMKIGSHEGIGCEYCSKPVTFLI